MTEHELQKSIIAEVNLRGNQDARWLRILAVPNGGQRHVAIAAKLKAEGVRAGVPDLLWPIASREFNGMAMELKVGKNQCSELQHDWLNWFADNGWYAVVVHDDAQAAIDEFAWYLGEVA